MAASRNIDMTEAIEKNSSRNTTRNLKLSVIYLCYGITIRTNIRKYTMHRKKRLVLSDELKSFSTLYFRLSTLGCSRICKMGSRQKNTQLFKKSLESGIWDIPRSGRHKTFQDSADIENCYLTAIYFF